MNISLKIKLTLERFLHNEDPIETSKKLITAIQKIVGINDVFGKETRRFTVRSMLSIVLFLGTFVYMGTFSQIIYLINMMHDKVELFKAMDCISATSVPLSKYFFMWTARNQLKTIFDLCRSGMEAIPKGNSAHNAFMKTMEKAQLLSWLVIGNQLLVHFLYLFVPFVLNVFGSKRYLPTTPGDPYGLSPKYESPNFELAYLITIFATTFSGVNQTGYIILFITILSHEIGHFYYISETLNTLYKDLSNKELTRSSEEMDSHVQKTLEFCIKQHQFIAKYHNLVKGLYKNIFGAHFLMMTVVLVTTLQTFSYWDLRNTLLTGLTGIMPLFIYCFGGEMLMTASMELSSSIYSSGWEMMSPKHSKIVLLMLVISQRPLFLTAANIFVMNRETFGDVVQIVYKVYTVFN